MDLFVARRYATTIALPTVLSLLVFLTREMVPGGILLRLHFPLFKGEVGS